MPAHPPVFVRRAGASPLRFSALVTALIVGGSSGASGQQLRLEIDPRASLAWWEVNPNLGHLWATTCTQDPAWQPGEGGSINAMVEYIRKNRVLINTLADSSQIPLYPRKVVRSLCTPAVKGEIVTADTVTWRGTRGDLAILAEHLRTGLDYRDEYARKTIYDTDRFPEIRFTIDSLRNVKWVAKDTLRADVEGSFEFRGIRTPMTIPVRAKFDKGGIRVQGQTHIPASYLVDLYGISKLALGLSVGLHVWKDLYMGVDVVLRPAHGGT